MTTTEQDVRVETSPKRVRAFLGGHVIFDTTAARLVWEVPYYPQYYVPRADVRATLVPTGRVKTSRSRGVGALHTVQVGGRQAVEGATIYDDTPVAELRDLVRFKWDVLDAWFEEDEEVYTHPRDPYTRVDMLPSSRHVTVEAGGVRVAESRRPHVLFETGLPARFYLPKVDVRADLLVPTDHVTHCPYKGQAEYWSIDTGEQVYENAVWSYRRPLPESVGIAGLLSFYPSKVDVVVDGVPLPSH